MEDIKGKKNELREEMIRRVESFSNEELTAGSRELEERLFEFANFMEANTVLLYLNRDGEVATESIVKRCMQSNKVLVLPAFNPEKYEMTLMKVENLEADLQLGPRGVKEPNPEKCKPVPINFIDIVVLPGLAFDEKGGRLGTGEGYYDRLIPKLPVTTRTVALSLEEQIISQVPMESHDKHVDIIITNQRIIYKI